MKDWEESRVLRLSPLLDTVRRAAVRSDSVQAVGWFACFASTRDAAAEWPASAQIVVGIDACKALRTIVMADDHVVL